LNVNLNEIFLWDICQRAINKAAACKQNPLLCLNQSVFSHKNFLSSEKLEFMVKIKNKRRLELALKQYKKRKSKQTDLAQFLGITSRRFRHLHSAYKLSGEVPIIGKSLGRPRKEASPEHEEIIVRAYNKYRLNALYLYLEKVIFAENHIRIPHNPIHKVLISKGLAKEVIDNYGYIQVIRKTITDHGTQFYANKRDKDGKAEHGFERFLEEHGIKHILCRYKYLHNISNYYIICNDRAFALIHALIKGNAKR